VRFGDFDDFDCGPLDLPLGEHRFAQVDEVEQAAGAVRSAGFDHDVDCTVFGDFDPLQGRSVGQRATPMRLWPVAQDVDDLALGGLLGACCHHSVARGSRFSLLRRQMSSSSTC